MKVLILGGTGMLGHMACRTFAADPAFDVFATARRPLPPSHPLRELVPKDRLLSHVPVEDSATLARVLATVRADVVLNCIGVIKQKKEAHAAIPSIEINSLFPHRLGALAAEVGSKVVHWSTDCVFSGAKGGYSERDNPDPVDLYGRSKLLGEVAEAPHLTLRSSLIGRELEPTASGLVEWFLSQRGKTIRGYKRAIFSGLTTHAMSRLIARLLQVSPGLSGVHHLAAAPISKFELLSRLNQRLDAGITIVPDEDFACDRSLDGSAFTAQTGLTAPSWDEMLEQLAQDCAAYETWRARAAGKGVS